MNFDELMECYHISDFDSNRVTYNELLQMFRRGNITPVIGAGLSSWAYPLWGEMLKGLAKDYGMESDIEELLNNNQYDVAASSLEKELSTNGFRSLLQKIFHISLLEVKKEECPVYLRNIPRLFHEPIVTTNFDRMIEYLFELDKKHRPDMVIPTDNLQNNKIDSALYNKESILVKLHGDIEDPTNLILTEDSYNEVYGKNPDEPDFDLAMPNFLRKILKKNPLLFLGCSLDKDRTCNVIKKCIGNCRQFAFLELPKETENKENPLVPSIRGEANKLEEHLRERKKYLIGELNIQPIWYPYGEHKEAYSVFFQQLCQDLGIRSEHFNYCLKSKMPYTKKVFHGRDNLIKEIHEIIHSGKKSIFLQGIGGIGKSETAKQYAKKYEKEYKNVLYLTYSSGLKELVCNSKTIEIENLQKYPDEKSDEFFRRKLELLKTMTNEKTLFIIDNFDVDTDPDLDDFLSGNYHVILTTRNSHPGYETKFVEAVKNWEDVLKIFTENYGRDITDNNDISCLK